MTEIVHQTLREQARARVTEWIDSGHLRPGERLKEEALSRTLGISRTPLREALLVLEEDGLLSSRAHRGFAVTSLNERMVRDVYPLIGGLEALALRTAPPPARLLDELTRLNDKLAAPRATLERRFRLDAEWHERVTGSHGNRILGTELTRLRRLARLHDGAGTRGLVDPDGSATAHAAILDSLRAGEVEQASSQLEVHWHHGMNVVLGWLKDRA